MAKRRSLSDQLNDALDALLSAPDAGLPSVDPALAPLLRVAAELRDLPSEKFKTQLMQDLTRRTSMAQETTGIMETHKLASPYLCVRDAVKALEFYKQAFGAEELTRFEDVGGRIGHAEIRIGDSVIMLADEYPDYGFLSPESIGGTAVMIHMYVPDVDAFFNRAEAAGATITRPVKDEFYGDRSGQLVDPFGHKWSFATHQEDVSEQEMKRRFDALQAQAPEVPRAKRISPVPAGFHSITPYLHVRGADQLIDFMKRAFGALEIGGRTTDPSGKIVHAEMKLGDSMIEIGEARGDIQPMPAALHFYVSDADALYQRAVQAGATSMYAPMDQPYGDREAGILDPFGNHWYIATRKRQVEEEEVQAAFRKEEPQPHAVSPIPKGFRTVTPYLVVPSAAKLIDFLKEALGAEELFRTTGSAGGTHAELKIGDSIIMMGDAVEDWRAYQGMFYLYVSDVDSLYERAVKAGGVSVAPPTDQPYGDRNSMVKDPFGNIWCIATHIKDV